MIDVYSCFPVAVQIACRELGFDMNRPLTVTGGLTFAGGPLNNYVMHSIARMAQLLRDNPGKRGMITANGGYITKHAFGIYSSEPPAQPFQHADLQDQVDAELKRDVVIEHQGRGTVEGYSVMLWTRRCHQGLCRGAAAGRPACLGHIRRLGFAAKHDRRRTCGRDVNLANHEATF